MASNELLENYPFEPGDEFPDISGPIESLEQLRETPGSGETPGTGEESGEQKAKGKGRKKGSGWFDFYVNPIAFIRRNR